MLGCLQDINHVEILITCRHSLTEFASNKIGSAVFQHADRTIGQSRMLNYYIQSLFGIESIFQRSIISGKLALRSPLRSKYYLL